jgi:hypothetical protein
MRKIKKIFIFVNAEMDSFSKKYVTKEVTTFLVLNVAIKFVVNVKIAMKDLLVR